MNTLKRILAFLISLSFVFALCACSSNDKDSNGEEYTDASTSNNPQDILKDYFVYINSNEYPLEQEMAMLADLDNVSIDKISSIYKKTQLRENKAEYWETRVEINESNIGFDFVFSYEISSINVVSEEQLQSAQSTVVNLGENIKATENKLDAGDITQIANKQHINKDEVKELLKAIRTLADTLINAEITEGCAIEYIDIQDGRELDEPKKANTTFTVYKINGKWISYFAIDLLRTYIFALMST